ncbi:MAG: hypothetical protein GY754_10185 [bacterium]|nr:hypothetical protein [bacterium]
MSLLSENEYKEGNGLIPRLAQTKMTSGLLGMLQSMGKSDALYNDSSGYTANNYSTWGARRKVFYGLEQLLTTLRSSEGEACANAYITLDSYPSWLYTDGVTNFRPAEDMQLDNLIEELVGFDDADFDGEGVPATVGKGLAAFPDRRETGTDSNTHFGYTWDGFSDSVELITELMRPGSEYCITGNLTNMLDSLFTGYKASDAELRSLRHTLGIILVSKIAYSSGDENPLKKMLTERVPTVLEEFQGHYANLLSLGKGLLQEDGLVAYMMSNLHSDFTAEETIDQLYDFLGSDIMYDPDSYLGGLFWADMEDLMTQMAGAMSSGSGEVNFYGDFGEVFEQ